jgi:hypothetical protein
MNTCASKHSKTSRRLPKALKDTMEIHVQLTDRSILQIDDLKAAVVAADEGDFASEDEVGKVFERLAAPCPARAMPEPAQDI